MGASGGVTAERKLPVSGEMIVVAAASGGSGTVTIGGISPAGGEGQTQFVCRANRCAMRVARSL